MADEKLIFPIGFDLEEGVAKVEKDWGKMQKRLQDTFKSQTIQVDADISKAVLDKLYAKFEGLIKTMESKAPQIKLKIPDTVDFEQEINRLKVQLKSINLGELTDAESKDLYLYIRQLEALAKALKEVNKQEQLRQANRPEVIALKQAQAEEKRTRSLANSALAEQRRAKIATESARQDEINNRKKMRASVEQARIDEINNRSAQRGAVIAEQKRAATARAENAELRLTRAKERSTQATHAQNAAYKTQGGYLQRLFQRMVAYASVAQAFSFVRNVRDVTAQFELQRVALGSIIGDLNEANAMFEQIKAAAVKSPFQIKELVTYTKQLAAYKIETDELFETTQRLADISAGLGVGMERLVLAYGQIRATGYLRASEVRQLTEAGIPIVEELAKKMSQLRGETVSAAEVMGLISERAISFGMVKEVFDDMTSAGGMFYKMQEKQAETLAGQWSNLQDAISIMYEEIGNTEGVNNSIKGMIGLVKSLAENWRTVAVVMVTALEGYGAYKGFSKIFAFLTASMIKLDVASRAHIASLRKMALAHQRVGALGKVMGLNLVWQTKLLKKAAQATNFWKASMLKLGAFLAGNIWNIALIGIGALVAKIVSARVEANRLNKELERIGAEGDVQSRTQVNNFERLAKVIRDSADGSLRQTEALKEMKRAYGEFLPSQDKEIINLVRAKEGYEAVSQAIREKIALQVQEQKINAVTSEYSKTIADYLPDLKELLEPDGIDVSRVYSALKTAIEEGSLTLIGSVKEDAEAINAILKKELGITLDLFSKGRLLTIRGWKDTFNPTRVMVLLRPILNAESDLRNAIQDIEYDLLSDTGITSIYAEKWDELQKNIKGITAKGEVGSFEWNKDKTRKEIELYHNFIKERIAEINEGLSDDKKIKFDIGDVLDFDALGEALGDNYPQLKQVIAKIQKEYEKLIPTDITRLANNKLQEYADKVGISMDDVKEHLKTNEQSTEDWAKGLKGAYESAEKKLAEYKKNQEAFSKQGAPFKDWSEDIEETTKEMKVLKLLMDFFKEFLKGGDTKQRKSQLSILQEELQLHEKIYAKYKEYRQYKSAEEAKAKVEDYFGDTIDALKFKPSFDKSGYQNVLTQYQGAIEALLAKAKDETERGAIKKVLLDLGFKIDDINWQDEKDKIEKSLKKLSDDLSRTKTAKEFFDRMLGMTGDKQLSATLTMSVYGIEKPEGELSEFFAKQLAEDMQKQIQEYLPNIDISSAINEATGEIDPVKLKGIIDALDPLKAGQTNIDAVKKLIKEMIDGNAKYLESLYDSYEKFLDYEHRKTIVAEREAQERANIAKQNIPDDEKNKLTEASKKRERTEKLKIDIEQFKAGEEYVKIFEEIENLSTMSIGRLMGALDKFMKDNAAVLEENPEQLKTLMGEYQKLYEGLITRNPFRAIVDGLKEYQSATKNVISARKELKKAEDSGDEAKIASAKAKLADALDKQQAALNQQVQGYQAASSAISNFGSIITDITEILGIAEDSEADAFIKDLVKWLGIMATVLNTVAAILIVINTVGAPFLAIAAGIAAIAASISYFANAKVRKANKEIERQQELLDQLAYSYERLEKAQEKAFGGDYISNYQSQLDNLQAQQEAYQKQYDAELSKGKKADEEKLKEYQDAVRDTADAIKDMQSELSEHFLGTDLTSAARDFANAWIDAYKEFGSTTDAMKAKFQDMIQNMIVESFAARVIQTALEPIFDSIDDMSKDGVLDASEASKIASMTEVAVGNIDVGMTNLMNALSQAGISVRGMGSDLTGISRDIATASEESILGLAAGINTQNFYISQVPPKLDVIIGLLQGDNLSQGSAITLQDLVTIQNQHLSYLPTIAQHTAETVAECKQIVAETRRTADALERVIKPDGTRTTYKMNVVTSYQG